jgi:ankyrin repeat protein
MPLGDNALYLLISKFSEPPREPPLDLVQAAMMECPKCIHYKISHQHYSTPLHWAARFGFSNLTQVLLQNGALPNCEDDEGKTPLHYAAEGSAQPGAAAQLLCRGGIVDAVSAASDTPLHLAAMMGNTAIAAALLMRGADPCRSCSDSFRPLHVAAFHGHGAMFALLCMYGGSITDLAADSYTPVDLARVQVIFLISWDISGFLNSFWPLVDISNVLTYSQGHLDIVEAALRSDSSEASVAIHSEVKKAMSDSRKALVQAAKETSSVAFWLCSLLAIVLMFAVTYGIYSFCF